MPKQYEYNNIVEDSANFGAGGHFGAAGFLDDVLNFSIFGDPNFSSDLWGELSGKNSQQREFEQQEYLMDKQNEYNSPVNQMERLKAAGINPNVAAEAIAGNNTSASPASVASNTQGAANALGQIASAVSGLAPLGSEIGLNEAQTGKNIADTVTANDTREALKNKLVSECKLTNNNASYLAEQIQYFGREASARITNLYANSDLARQEIQLYQSQMEKMHHEIDLIKNEADYQGWLAATQQFIKFQQEWYAEFMKNHNFDPRCCLDSQFVQLAAIYGINSQEAINFATAVQDYNQAQEQSKFNFDMAKIDKEFDNMLEQIGTTIDAETKSKIKTSWIELVGKLLGAGASIGSAFILK